MLDRCHKADSCLGKKGNCGSYDCRIKIHPGNFIDHTRGVIDRGMTQMDQNISILKDPEIQVTGTVTGITTDQNREPCIPEIRCQWSEPAFQSFRCLQSNSYRMACSE